MARSHCDQELRQFVADSLSGYDGQSLRHLSNGRQRLVVGFESQRGLETEEAQHSKRVVSKRDLRGRRGAKSSRRDVGQPTKWVDRDHVGEGESYGIHREIATTQVAGYVV